jgi:hypothetical protein
MRHSATVEPKSAACRWYTKDRTVITLRPQDSAIFHRRIYVSDHAARHGNIAMLEWLMNKGRLDDTYAMQAAACTGNLRVIDWLKANYYSSDEHRNVPNVMWYAAKCGQLHVIKYLEADGCPLDASGCKYLFDRPGNDETKVYLHRGRPRTWSCRTHFTPCAWARAHRSDALSEQ